MRHYISLFIIFFAFSAHAQMDKLTAISKANQAKEAAVEAYEQKNFEEAITQYSILLDTLGEKNDKALLNRGHAHFILKDTLQAINDYTNAAQSELKQVSSMAFNQLGVMHEQLEKQEIALNYYKEGLRRNPESEALRYNYELLKKKLDKKKGEQQQQDKDQDQEQQEPSEYAKQLKAQAEKLVEERKYKEAFELMTAGLQKDKTVGYYKDFIKRLKDITEIL